MNNAFSKFFILIILVIIFIGGFLARQYFGTPKEKDKTADWRIYRNAEDGFEIKYPPDWNYIKSANTISFYEGKWKGEGNILLSVLSGNLSEIYERWKNFWSKSKNCLLETCSVEQFYRTPNECKGPCKIEETETLVAGKKSRVILIKNNPLGFVKEVFIEGENWVIKLSTSADYEKIFDQMLSTFRFLE